MSRKNRKQNYIDSHVQGSLLRRIFTHWLIFFGVLGLTVVLLQTLLGDPSLTLMERMTKEIGEFTFLGIVMLCLLPAFMLDTIRFSNRFVGPIARVRRHLRQLATGNTERCTFRGDDFWSELAEEFNAAAAKVEAQQKEIDELKASLTNTNA